jgi:hypothetical protein
MFLLVVEEWLKPQRVENDCLIGKRKEAACFL